jgi:hypothetical protein
VNIEDRLKLVQQNEVDCETHAANARAAWAALKAKSKEAATPWRIVTVGAIGGFLMGRSSTVDAAGSSVGGKLFATVAEALVTSLGASVAAGAAAVSAADAAASATSDALANADAPAAADEADALDSADADAAATPDLDADPRQRQEA